MWRVWSQSWRQSFITFFSDTAVWKSTEEGFENQIEMYHTVINEHITHISVLSLQCLSCSSAVIWFTRVSPSLCPLRFSFFRSNGFLPTIPVTYWQASSASGLCNNLDTIEVHWYYLPYSDLCSQYCLKWCSHHFRESFQIFYKCLFDYLIFLNLKYF